jgi:protein-tyrosine phosphatase
MFFSSYIKNNFGSKRGLLNAAVFAFRYHLGFYKKYQQIRLNEINRFVFVCSGNICRSVLAEYVAKQQGVDAISFGLDTRGGDKVDSRSIDFAESHGIDLKLHITQNIKYYAPKTGDLLIGMEPDHATKLELLFGNQVPITLLGFWLKPKQIYIHDPYNTNIRFFHLCESKILRAVKSLIKER